MMCDLPEEDRFAATMLTRLFVLVAFIAICVVVWAVATGAK